MSKKEQLQLNIDQIKKTSQPDKQFANMLYSPQNQDQRTNAAAKIQRILSSNLAAKFISCWKSLKNLLYRTQSHLKFSPKYAPRVQQQNNRRARTRSVRHLYIAERQNDSNRHGFSSLQRRRQDFRYKNNNSNEDYHVLLKSKSTDMKQQTSRVQLLAKIAQKLKQNRSKYQYNHNQQEENSYTINKRLTKLEKIMKNVRKTNQITDQKAICSRIQIEKASQKLKQNQQIFKMAQQISSLKTQIIHLKNQNESIMQKQVDRSRREQNVIFNYEMKKSFYNGQDLQLKRSYHRLPYEQNFVHLPKTEQLPKTYSSASYNLSYNNTTPKDINFIRPGFSHSTKFNFNNYKPIQSKLQSEQGVTFKQVKDSIKIGSSTIFHGGKCCTFCGRSCLCPPTQEPIIKNAPY